jgi:hypothetical protein
MKYQVLWTPTAEQDLAEVRLRANDRASVTSAAESVDRLLEDDAPTRGESRFDDLRVMFALPLGVSFEADEQDRVAYVLAVWPIR